MYRQYPFLEQKQQEAKVKVKETDPTWSQNRLFPVTPSHAFVDHVSAHEPRGRVSWMLRDISAQVCDGCVSPEAGGGRAPVAKVKKPRGACAAKATMATMATMAGAQSPPSPVVHPTAPAVAPSPGEAGGGSGWTEGRWALGIAAHREGCAVIKIQHHCQKKKKKKKKTSLTVQRRGHGFDLCLGKIPHAMQYGQ